MASPQQPIDLLSQMQAELHRLSELFYSTIGELQQNALPVRVNDEELIRASSTSYDAGARSQGFSTELMQVSLAGMKTSLSVILYFMTACVILNGWHIATPSMEGLGIKTP